MGFLKYLSDSWEDILKYVIVSFIVGFLFLLIYLIANGDLNFIFEPIRSFISSLFLKSPYLFIFGLGFGLASIESIIELISFYNKYYKK